MSFKSFKGPLLHEILLLDKNFFNELIRVGLAPEFDVKELNGEIEERTDSSCFRLPIGDMAVSENLVSDGNMVWLARFFKLCVSNSVVTITRRGDCFFSLMEAAGVSSISAAGSQVYFKSLFTFLLSRLRMYFPLALMPLTAGESACWISLLADSLPGFATGFVGLILFLFSFR